MGNKQVKNIINEYIGGAELNDQQRLLLKQNLNADTIHYYIPDDIPEYLEVIRNLYKYVPHNENTISKRYSSLIYFEILGLFSKYLDIRLGQLNFNPVLYKNLAQYFIHTTRPHPLREQAIGKPNMILSGELFDMAEAQRLSWLDHDIDGEHSGYLIFLLHNEKSICGGIASIDTIKTEFRSYFVHSHHHIHDTEYTYGTYHVHSLFIKSDDVLSHKLLISAGILFLFGDNKNE